MIHLERSLKLKVIYFNATERNRMKKLIHIKSKHQNFRPKTQKEEIPVKYSNSIRSFLKTFNRHEHTTPGYSF